MLTETTVPEGPAALPAQLLEVHGGQLPDKLAHAQAQSGAGQLFADDTFGGDLISGQDVAAQLTVSLAERVGGLPKLAELSTEPQVGAEKDIAVLVA